MEGMPGTTLPLNSSDRQLEMLKFGREMGKIAKVYGQSLLQTSIP
jgi:hypothetical protein